MMDFKPGDKVKFLNEEGGGVVAKIIDHKMVAVTIEDGFDIPTLKSDLIKLEQEGSSGNPSPKDFTTETTDEDVRQRSEQQSYSVPMGRQGDFEQGCYLVFQPEPGKPLLTGTLDVYLFNNSDYQTYYTINLAANKALGLKYHGYLRAYSREYLDTLALSSVDTWSKGLVQLLFFAEQKIPLLPYNDFFRVRAQRFYKEDNYRKYKGWESELFVLKLADPQYLQKADDDIASLPAKDESREEKAKPHSHSAIIDRHMISETEAKVDLHIEQLVNDYHRMNSMEILNLQINYFKRILESALQNGLQRLIIIHGVGAGILKAEIRRELGEYDFIDVQDAPIADYGVGATIARIYQS